jgi:hypothetical protein
LASTPTIFKSFCKGYIELIDQFPIDPRNLPEKYFGEIKERASKLSSLLVDIEDDLKECLFEKREQEKYFNHQILPKLEDIREHFEVHMSEAYVAITRPLNNKSPEVERLIDLTAGLLEELEVIMECNIVPVFIKPKTPTSTFRFTGSETALRKLHIQLKNQFIDPATLFEDFQIIFTAKPLSNVVHPVLWKYGSISALLFLLWEMSNKGMIDPKEYNRLNQLRLKGCFALPAGKTIEGKRISSLKHPEQLNKNVPEDVKKKLQNIISLASQ